MGILRISEVVVMRSRSRTRPASPAKPAGGAYGPVTAPANQSTPNLNIMNDKPHSAISLAILTFTAWAGMAACALAHHGQDFLLLEDHHLPAPGQGHLMTNFEWEKYPNADEFGLSPGILFGILPQVALGVDVHFRDESDGWNYTNVMPSAHFQITPPDLDFPIKVGLSIGYQFADGAAGDEEEPRNDHAEDDHEHGDHNAGDDHEHQAEEGHSHSHSGSIHNHDNDLLASRLIIESDFGNTKILFNLLSLVEDGGDAAWGYAAGVRQKVCDQLALGVEAMGDFESDGWHELVGGIYYEPVHSLTLKLGAGFGLTEESPDFILHSGLVWRF